MRKKAVNSKPTKRNKVAGAMPWHYFLLMILCIAVMTAGFFFTAVQHFSAIDLSIKNSEMRARISKMESEHRRLRLEREIAGSPAQIRKTALRMGFREFDATAEFASLTTERPANLQKADRPVNNAEPKPETAVKPAAEKPVVKTPSKPESKPEPKPEVKRSNTAANRTAEKPAENKKKPEAKPVRNEVAKLDTRAQNAPRRQDRPAADTKRTASAAPVNRVRVAAGSNAQLESRPRRVN